jgi:hypothetical protein
MDDEFAAIIELEHDQLKHVARSVGTDDELAPRCLAAFEVGNHDCPIEGVLDRSVVDAVLASC